MGPTLRRGCWCVLALLGAAAPLSSQQFRNPLPLPLDVGRILAPVDIDLDGDVDLITAQDRGLGIALNDGLGRYPPSGRSTIQGFQTLRTASVVAAADVDGDGDVDLVVGTYFAEQTYLLRNDGPAGFTDVTAAQMPQILCDTARAALVDVDGDGDLDLFLANRFQDFLHLNDGSGTFTDVTGTNLPAPSGVPETIHDLEIGDVDGDGDPDLFLAMSSERTFRINDGSGRFTISQAPGVVPLQDVRGVVLEDLDGDGDLDLFYAATASTGLYAQDRLWLNDGSGTFINGNALLPFDQEFDEDAVAADVDGDGRLDLVIAGRSLSRVYLNSGPAGFNNATAGFLDLFFAPVDPFSGIDAVDWDGDGDPDLLVRDRPDRLLRNDGTGRMTDALRVPLDPGDRPLLSFDPDGDQDQDLLVDRGGLALLENDGTGSLLLRPRSVPSFASPSAAAAGDVDGDGDPDLVVVLGTRARLLGNNGSGSFVDISQGRLDSSRFGGDALLFDMDGDGDLDLMGVTLTSAIFVPTRDRLFSNDGTGRFTDVSNAALPAGGTASRSADAGDVDGDGDLDLILGNGEVPAAGPAVRLLLNQGNGTFLDATARFNPQPPVAAPVLARFLDMEGDGDLDVVTSGPRLYENRGASFVDLTTTNVPTVPTSSFLLSVADVDDDGDPDVLVGGSLLLNDGTGVFTDATAARVEPTDPARLLADLDSDGDPEWVGVGEVLVNHHRQLTIGRPPVTGSTATVEITTAPGYAATPYSVLIGLSFGRLPSAMIIPNVGQLYLDPLTLTVVGTSTTSVPQGTGGFSIPVPGNAGLVGLDLFLQGLAVDLTTGSARLTNMLPVRIE